MHSDLPAASLSRFSHVRRREVGPLAGAAFAQTPYAFARGVEGAGSGATLRPRRAGSVLASRFSPLVLTGGVF